MKIMSHASGIYTTGMDDITWEGRKGVRVSLEKLAFRDQSKEEESGKSDEKEELKRWREIF